MVSRKFVETVGFMDEGVFYIAKSNWGCRSKGKFDLAYAPEAPVYHKEGVTTGWNGRTFRLKSLYLREAGLGVHIYIILGCFQL